MQRLGQLFHILPSGGATLIHGNEQVVHMGEKHTNQRPIHMQVKERFLESGLDPASLFQGLLQVLVPGPAGIARAVDRAKRSQDLER